MLAFLRRRKRSWIIVFFVTMIVLVFVLWGVGRYMNERGSDSPAQVNGKTISSAEFAFHYQRLVDQYRSLLKGSLTEETLKSLNLKSLVLQELVQRQMLLQEAQRLGLETADEELRTEIGKTPEFQADGRFDQNRYLQTLRANRLTPAQFESERRVELTLRKLYGLIGDSVTVTENELQDRYRFEQEKLNLYFIRLSTEPFLPQVKLTEDEIQAYYQQNREALKEPLRVQVEYIAYPLEHFASKVQVSDREVEEFYKTREPKTRSLKEVRAEITGEIRKEKGKTEAGKAASADHEKALAGTTLSQLAKERGLSLAQSGLFSQFEVVPEVGPVEEFNRGAFSLSVNEVSPVIEGKQAYYVLKLKKRQEPSVLPLAQVHSQIEKGIREKKAFELMLQKAKALLSQLKTEKDIRGMAKKNGLGVEETNWFPRHSPQIPKIGPLEGMAPGGITVSTHQPIPDRIYTGRGAVYLFALKESQPADMERFQQEKKALQERMLVEKQQRAMQRFLEGLKAKAQIKVSAQALE